MTVPSRFAARLWLSSGELVELAPVSRRKVAELCATGVLRGRKEGHEWWIESESAWKWLGLKPSQETLRPNVARMLGRTG